MPSSEVRDRISALRAEAAAVGALLMEDAPRMGAEELFEVAGELQGVCNAADGAQLVAVAHAAAHETRLTGQGPVEVHHAVGFVDAMASSEVSLATGVGQWAAGRRVGLAAGLAERFPRLLAGVVAGDLACATVAKVVAVCDGLDLAACTAVEAVLVDRLAGLDPARVTTVARRVATRVAADQVAAASARNTRDRCVEVSPGPDGTTRWWAQLPAGRSAAAWAAVTALADTYTEKDPSLTADQARADALLDLVLTDVHVTASVTLGIPVITGPDADTARRTALEGRACDATAADTTAAGAGITDGTTGVGGATDSTTDGGGCTTDGTTAGGGTGDGTPGERPAPAVAGLGLGDSFSISAALTGCEVPRIGWIDADTVEVLLSTVPLHIGRALLDARTGTVLETTTTAYRPTPAVTDFITTRDGTCRMWGCDRPAHTCDVDHARPWPAGATTPANLGHLCRRHHRLKQHRRWSYTLHPDGTATWTSPSGTTRTTDPDHATLSPPPPPAPGVTNRVAPDRGGGELATVDPPPF